MVFMHAVKVDVVYTGEEDAWRLLCINHNCILRQSGVELVNGDLPVMAHFGKLWL